LQENEKLLSNTDNTWQLWIYMTSREIFCWASENPFFCTSVTAGPTLHKTHRE